ncbi:hypothetical protein BDK51DRAFT_42246 [Blyttiomyces helicus]|uniref:Uncharacterized protein n=1 Tax=Blyttiomyces helicus TaxID=388810 RepID=A0A4P9WMT4_9FUNG|nr:hypothetical protein BDK51DRAFT_42246 [Blyttiomyces helicus]|eukprot:RKO93343.1 hypothetical protein BDK51DRAFT_42246 [Blyttiomyces helicus]
MKKKLVEARGDEEEAPPVPKRRRHPRIHAPKQGPSKPRGRPRKCSATDRPLPSTRSHSKSDATFAPSVFSTLPGPLAATSVSPSSSGLLAANTSGPTLMTFPIYRPPGSEPWVTAPPLASLRAVKWKPPVTDPAPIDAAAASSGPAPAPSATSSLSATAGTPNEASVDSNIVEPQGVKHRTQPYPPFPWITQDAIPARLTDGKLSRRLTISDKAFKNTETTHKKAQEKARMKAEEEARNKAEEKERFKKLMESKMTRGL